MSSHRARQLIESGARCPLGNMLPLGETPSAKPQAPKKLQISNTETQRTTPGQTAAGF
jgi:hypothetical protein